MTDPIWKEDDDYVYLVTDGFIISKHTRLPMINYDKKGYMTFRDKHKKNHKVHRVLYEQFLGEAIPSGMFVRHLNGDPSDNRIANLSLGTVTQNSQERGMQRNNLSGYKNICWRKDIRQWQVQFTIKGKTKYYGYFKNIADAIAVRDKAIKELNAQGHCFIVEYPDT